MIHKKPSGKRAFEIRRRADWKVVIPFSKRLLLASLLLPLWIFLRSAYRDRIGAFGCFDDCFNIMGGHFLLRGKRLFSEIFFNHMPAMAHLSAWIQAATKPDSIYMLIYQHRMFMIYFSLIADVLLVLRFGLPALAFAFLYESTKGFIFGERFLAEGLIVYPLVYALGVSWEALRKGTVRTVEVWIMTLLTLGVVFSREPYIPLALFLWGTVLWKAKRVPGIVAIAAFVAAAGVLVVSYGPRDFFFNVVTVSRRVIDVESQLTSSGAGGLAAVVLYPILLFFKGEWNLFHQVEAIMSAFFLLGVVWFAKRGEWGKAIWWVGVLTLANIRTIAPGSLYYGTFHHLPWYALIVAGSGVMMRQVWPKLFVLAFAATSLYAIVSPASYLHEKVDRQTEFTTNYGHYYVVGEVVRRLSDEGSTLFLDGQDDLIYWQAKRYSSYPYSWYTSLMPYFPRYTDARSSMFKNNPPEYYYGSCSENKAPEVVLPTPEAYVRLSQNGKPSCLWIRRDTLTSIPADAWQSVSEFRYTPPPTVLPESALKS